MGRICDTVGIFEVECLIEEVASTHLDVAGYCRFSS